MSAPLSANDFVQKRSDLVLCKNAERKAHEIRVPHQLGEKIEIFLADWMEITRGVRESAFS